MPISGMIGGMISRKVIVLLLLASFATAQQAPRTEPKTEKSESKTIIVDLQPANEPELDTQALVKETEFVDSRNHKMGVFWWVPIEFWEISLQKQGISAESAKKAFAPFQKYNLLIVGVGDVGLGNISWMKDADIKKRVMLRFQHLYLEIAALIAQSGKVLSGGQRESRGELEILSLAWRETDRGRNGNEWKQVGSQQQSSAGEGRLRSRDFSLMLDIDG